MRTSTSSRVYGHDGPGLRRLKDIIEKINYPDLKGICN
jgi:hypothetical protein